MSRECTNQLLEMVDEGLLDPAPLLAHCLGWMGIVAFLIDFFMEDDE